MKTNDENQYNPDWDKGRINHKWALKVCAIILIAACTFGVGLYFGKKVSREYYEYRINIALQRLEVTTELRYDQYAGDFSKQAFNEYVQKGGKRKQYIEYLMDLERAKVGEAVIHEITSDFDSEQYKRLKKINSKQ